MKELCLALLFAGGSMLAQLVPPRIGLVTDLSGVLRPVLGVSGNFLLGDPMAASVISAGCSGTFSFVKTDSALSILDGANKTDFPAPPGPALFSFSGHAGFVYFASDGTLRKWDGTSMTLVPLGAFEGTVLSLAQPDASHVWLAVRQSDGRIYVALMDSADGSMLESISLTNSSASLALLNGQEFLYPNREGFAIHRANGVEISLAAPAVNQRSQLRFERFGDNWWSVKVRGGRHFAIRTDAGREQLYLLPENAQ